MPVLSFFNRTPVERPRRDCVTTDIHHVSQRTSLEQQNQSENSTASRFYVSVHIANPRAIDAFRRDILSNQSRSKRTKAL
jgi:hypothetical protein